MSPSVSQSTSTADSVNWCWLQTVDRYFAFDALNLVLILDKLTLYGKMHVTNNNVLITFELNRTTIWQSSGGC